MQNSLNHRQAISTALDESFATVLDFGPEEFSSSEDEKQQSEITTTVRHLNSENVPKVEVKNEVREPQVNLAPDVIPRENVPNLEEPIFEPKVAPEFEPDLTPQIRPRVTSQFEPDLTSDVQEIVPKVSQDLTPKVVPKVTQDSAPKVEPKITQELTPQIRPSVTSQFEPDLTSEIVTPTWTPEIGPKVEAEPILDRILDAKEIEIIERVTSVDESVTPLLDEPTDWSMRTIPDPPSGFKDSLVIPDQKQPEMPVSALPTIVGPMKFSIDSYNDRKVKEEPYVVKLSRTESMRDEQAPVFAREKAAPTVSKAESFSLARFNGESTISGNSFTREFQSSVRSISNRK